MQTSPAVRATIVINSAACTGCGTCVESCPTDVIRLDQGSRKAVIVYADDCQGCFLCEIDCPVLAIRVETVRWFTTAQKGNSSRDNVTD